MAICGVALLVLYDVSYLYVVGVALEASHDKSAMSPGTSSRDESGEMFVSDKWKTSQ